MTTLELICLWLSGFNACAVLYWMAREKPSNIPYSVFASALCLFAALT